MPDVYRVMLAEGDLKARDSILGMISDSSGSQFVVEEFGKLTEIFERLQRGGEFDLILLDFALMDGEWVGAIERIRQIAPDPAIIVMSAVDDEDLALRMIQEGVQDFLVKQSLTSRALVRSMRRAIELMHVEVALAHERDLLQAIMENIPQGIYFKDLRSRFIRISRNLAGAFNLADPSEAIGKTDLDFLTESHARTALEDEQQVIRTGNAIVNKEEKATQPDGSTLWVLTTKMPLRNHRGRVIGTFGISRDVTELKTAQEHLSTAHERLSKSYEELKEMQLQLIAAEKMNMAGRLAAGLAHEIKNPLAMIRIGVDFLMQNANPGADEGMDMTLKTMLEGIDRASGIVMELQTFAASGALALACENLDEVVRNAIELLQHELLSREIGVITRFAADLPKISIDRKKIVQVLLSVMTNAIDALGEGGSITVTTRSRVLGAAEVSPNAGNRSGVRFREGEAVVAVEIDDSGPGIPGETLSKIFDPFFTTKPTGQGTGLGLTVGSKLMEFHEGELRVENRTEGGVRSTLLFKQPPVGPA